ncbi:MAG: GSCFA domain-containing protein [Saprospiraceae bacterium]
MKTFRTTMPMHRASFGIAHTDQLLLVGSCFTEHIGERLEAGKFQALTNPNGIVYNPVSIARSLIALQNAVFDPENAVFEYQGLWHSWKHHGRFSHPDRETALQNFATAHAHAAVFLKKTNRLLLTLGTADVFTLRETGQVVANNHKVPADRFEQRRLSVAETTDVLEQALSSLHTANPALRVVLTVSPVRHLRAGLVDNQRSKAVLVLACAELCQRLEFVHYFPAYELLLDDLRDYRFYAADMLHPSGAAVDYIWEYFTETFFLPQTQNLLERIGKITTAARHRPFHPGSAEHRAFTAQQIEHVRQLCAEHPRLDFSEEITVFSEG